MDFQDALTECFAGKKITNENWNGKGMYVEVVNGGTNEYYEVLLPYLQITNIHGEKIPWVPSTGDLFSDKWKTED